MKTHSEIAYWGIWGILIAMGLVLAVGACMATFRTLRDVPEISILTRDLPTPPLCAAFAPDVASVELQRSCRAAVEVVKATRKVLNFRALGSSPSGGLLGVSPAEERSSAGQFPDRGNFSRAGTNPSGCHLSPEGQSTSHHKCVAEARPSGASEENRIVSNRNLSGRKGWPMVVNGQPVEASRA